MSEENLKELLARLATEPEFGARVRANPEALRSGFGLTEAEADELARMASQASEPVAAAASQPAPQALETRESKSGIHPAVLIGGGATATAAVAGGAYVIYSRGRGGSEVRYLLSLSGQPGGYLKSVDGGSPTADITIVNASKHIGGLKYEPITLEIGLDMDPRVYEWPAGAWKASSQRQDGSVVALDANLKAISQMDFFKAMLAEVSIPALDTGSKDTGYLTFKLNPESTKVTPLNTTLKISTNAKNKQWRTSSFQLKVDGLDTSRVNRIDAFKVSQSAADAAIGESREKVAPAGPLDCSNLVVELAASTSEAWVKWFNQFVVAGNNGPDQLRNGSIRFLSTDGKSELGRVDLLGLGIFSLVTKPGRDEAIPRVVASLYCNRAELHVPGDKVTADAVSAASPNPASSPSASPAPASPTPAVSPVPSCTVAKSSRPSTR